MLSEDPRPSFADVAERLGVSRNTIHARVGRLTSERIMDGFSAQVRLSEVGAPVEAFVDVELAQGTLQAVIKSLTAMANVLEVHATTGRADLMVRVATPTHAALQRLLQDMYGISGVNRTTTHIILSTPVTYRVTPLLFLLTDAAGRGRAGR